MQNHLLLTIRLHGDGQGSARFHGTVQGAPEWPPAPARVFQALVSGSARGNALPEDLIPALEWLEGLPPPIIAAPRAHFGQSVSLFVPNNDADAVPNPSDVSGIRTKKVVHPSLLDEDEPFLYAWAMPEGATPVASILNATNELYQLGRGIDMAWATGEVIDDDSLQHRLTAHGGTVHRPEPHASGKALACPVPGSLASLVQRHRATRLRLEGKGKSARLLFTNAPKPLFLGISYGRVQRRTVYQLRDGQDDTKTWPWRLERVVELITSIRDGAAERLREGLPNEHAAIERTLIGRKADGTDPSPVAQRVRMVPLPSIGHEHADRAIRRILLEVPSGGPLGAAEVEWAVSGLETANAETGVVGSFVLTRVDSDDMLRHYTGPSRRWRSVTAVSLPESAQRRRIDPSRQREDAKSARERSDEEDRAVAAVHTALRHAGILGTAIRVHVQREPFDGNGERAEAFAEGRRFIKERLWHVELELDRALDGPLVIGDGRFLGLGLMAPVVEPRPASQDSRRTSLGRAAPVVPTNRSGLFSFEVVGRALDDSIALSNALRRAVLARVQQQLGQAPLGRFFSGHEEDGGKSRASHSSHLAFQWDAAHQRLLVFAPHWLDRREPSREERQCIDTLEKALAGLRELRAGVAGRFALRRSSINADDPLLVAARSWRSVTPYTVTRHRKHSSSNEALIEDVRVECRRRGFPSAAVTVLKARGIPGRGLEGRVQLEFAVAVRGPLLLGRTRFLGGGLFAPSSR